MSASSVLKTNSHNANKKSAVYYYYRDMLENYNHKANKILENLPATTLIREDKGINDKIETILQNSKGNEWMPQQSSETKERNGIETKNVPPLCIQNAMLTKDKKPFTYTPGGINLSEIRSPNMARRLELNAQSEGTASARDMRNGIVKNSANYLPPSALAAMQPALPVQVLPKITPKKEQPSSSQINNTQSINSANAVKINQKFQTAPPPAPPLPISQQNFYTETNVPSKLVSLKTGNNEQYEKPSIQKNVHFESDRNFNQNESNLESKKSVIPQNLAPNIYSSPVLLNLNKSPTPWVPRRYNDFRETIVPCRTEQKNVEEKTILSPIRNNINKEETSDEKSEKNEHIIPVKIEEFSNNVNCDFRADRNNWNYEKMDRTSKTSSRIIPIEVDDSFTKQSSSPQMSPSGRSSARYKIQSVNPIQSRSFRILQKMTDSYEDDNNNNNNDISGCNNICNIKNIALSNTFENHRRSNTHSPALEMYEDKIRSQQQMNYGKAYKILHHGDDICDTYDRVRLDMSLKNGQFHNLTTKTSTKQIDKNCNNVALSVLSLKSKQNDGQAINIKHSDSNRTNCLKTNGLGVSETEVKKRIDTNDQSNENNAKKPIKKYVGGRTHSRLLHLVT